MSSPYNLQKKERKWFFSSKILTNQANFELATQGFFSQLNQNKSFGEVE